METMDMLQSCKDCRRHAKHVYWNHQVVRFIQKMSNNSFWRLSIPKNFARNFRGQLSEIIALRGPSGNTWDVVLKRTGDDMMFEKGWREFAEDHSLAENDTLMFTFSGDSQFDVLIFHRCGVEKVSSHFIKKCKNKQATWHQVKKKAKQDFSGPSHASPTICEDFTTSEEPESEYETYETKPQINIKTAKSSEQAARATQYVLRSRGKRKDLMEGIPCNPDRQNVEQRPPKTRFCDVKLKEMAPPDGWSWKGYPRHFISHRRPVTEQEEDRAWRLALSLKTANPSFRAKMQLTHVSRRFSMSIPADFVKDHLPNSSQLVEVRNANGEAWHVFYDRRDTRSSSLSGGWENFVFDNNLELGDACVFELSSEGKQIVFRVHIFRVVEPVVPLTRLTRSNKEKMKANTNQGTRRGR